MTQVGTALSLDMPTRIGMPSSLSARRITELNRLIRETASTTDARVNTDSLQVTILNKYSALQRSIPLQPVLPLLVLADCKRVAAEKAAKSAHDRYPQLDLEVLAEQAQMQFPMVKPGQMVKVSYRVNPGHHTSIAGIFKGRIGDALIIDSHKILIRDLVPPPPLDTLIMQFDEKATEQKRKEYVDQESQLIEDRRRNFYNHEYVRILIQERAQAVIENENRGYLWYQNAWRTPAAIVTLILKEQAPPPAPSVTTASPGPELKADPRKEPPSPAPSPIIDDKRHRLQPTVDSKAIAATDDSRLQISPDDVIIAAAIQGEDLTEEDYNIILGQDLADLPEADTKQATLSASSITPTPETVPATPPPQSFFALYVQQFITIVLIVLVAIGAWVVSHYLTREKSISRFYTQLEVAEKEFWELAESPGTKYAYVAFIFADYTQAYRAISRLSYIHQKAPNQPMKSSLPIHFGIYPNAEGEFIAFVGGEQLTLPAWREAWAVFVNSEDGAEYRVSDPPDTELDIPNNFLTQNESSLSFARDYDGTDGDYSHYVIFKGQSKNLALTFLKLFRHIKTGIHIVVETPEGHWGRDESGIYRE